MENRAKEALELPWALLAPLKNRDKPGTEEPGAGGRAWVSARSYVLASGKGSWEDFYQQEQFGCKSAEAIHGGRAMSRGRGLWLHQIEEKGV